MRQSKALLKLFGVVVSVALCIIGCSSDTDSNTDYDYEDDIFVGDGESGSIDVRVNQTSLPIAGTSGFFVDVRDANGGGVANLRVLCDSEEGIAIIEPRTGSESTDSDGSISGSIGCEQPGSFRFGCRLPIGTNLREFVTIQCTGEVPNGFVGFPGAAGGGLGGGVVDVIDPTEGLSVESVSFSDGGAQGFTIDIVQNSDCDGNPTSDDPEPYTDSVMNVSVENISNQDITFTGISYRVNNYNGAGVTYTQPTVIPLTSPVTVTANGGSATVSAVVFDAAGAGKRFADNITSISVAGIRTMSFVLVGANSEGVRYDLTGQVSVNFDNYDRCNS